MQMGGTSPPIPYTFGCQYVRKVISSATTHTILEDQVLAIIQNTDFQVLGFVLSLFIENLSEQGNSKLQQVMKNAIKHIVSRSRNSSKFKNVVINVWNDQKQFPDVFLSQIPSDTAFVLAVYGCSSTFRDEARTFLQQNVLPGLASTPNFYVDNELLFELCSLDIKGFNSEALFNRESSTDLMVFANKCNDVCSVELPEDDMKVQVVIDAVAREAGPEVLSSEARLTELFDFFPSFDHIHAARFLLAIVSPGCSFGEFCSSLDDGERQKVFLMFMELLTKKNVSFPEMICALDQPVVDSLSEGACALLFSIVSTFFEKQLIPGSAFTHEWNNKSLHFCVLNALTRISVPSLDFSKTPGQFNRYQLAVQNNAFSHCNNCWMSIDFAERAIELSKDSPSRMAMILDGIMTTYPAVVLSIFSQTNAVKTQHVMAVAVDALQVIIDSGESEQIVAGLWTNSRDFLTNVVVSFYDSHVEKRDAVFEAMLPYFDHLIFSCDSVAFVVDLAIYVHSHGACPFPNFVARYLSRFSVSAITRIADIIGVRVTDQAAVGISVSDVVVNCFFQYVSDNFARFPVEAAAFVGKMYLACKKTRPRLADFTFDVKYTKEQLDEIRKTACENYEKLICDRMSVTEFLTLLYRLRTEGPKLYSCMIHYLMEELQYLDRHTYHNVEKLGDIVGRLVTSAGLGSESRSTLIAFLERALTDREGTVRFGFAVKVLTLLLPRLRYYPSLVMTILHESSAHRFDPQLLAKVRQLAKTMKQPIKSSASDCVKLHPGLKRFECLPSPPPRVCKAIQLVRGSPSGLGQLLSRYPEYSDWFGNYIVSAIVDQPHLGSAFAAQVNGIGSFWRSVYCAAAAQVIKKIAAPGIDKYEGAYLRREMLLLGRFIGRITIAVNRPLLSQFLDIKKLLFYSLSKGKMMAVVPFICAILSVGSPLYDRLNPFVASICQILAGIFKTNSVKLGIKQHIQNLFDCLCVNMNMFGSISEYSPEKWQDNYDFQVMPLCLKSFASTVDTECIAIFDKPAFEQWAAPRVVLPKGHRFHGNFELRERVKKGVIDVAYDIIRQQSETMSVMVASTVSALISMDFSVQQEYEIASENAGLLTRQFAASVVLPRAPVKVSGPLRMFLKAVVPETEVCELAQSNYEWIVQLLREIVEFRALATVQQTLDEAREAKGKQKLPTTLRFDVKERCAVYADLCAIPFTQQPMPRADFQERERQIPIDDEFERYLEWVQKTIPSDSSREYPTDVGSRMVRYPTFEGDKLSFARFLAILKTILMSTLRAREPGFDRIACKILAHVCTFLHERDRVETQIFVVMWMETTILSFVVIRELVLQRLITTEQLDKLLTSMLNVEPFSTRNTFFVIGFLHYAIVETRLLEANCMISSLSDVYFLGLYARDMQSKSADCQYWLDALRKIFDEMEAPVFSVATGTKLQFVSTFDPLEDVADSETVLEAIREWKTVIAGNDESVIKRATERCIAHGKNVYLALCMNEDEQTSMRFLGSVIQLVGVTDDLIEALAEVISGNSCVVGFDMRRYCSILRLVMEFWNDHVSFAALLHRLRPLAMPSFAVDWIELAAERNLVYALVSNTDKWSSLMTLVLDFAAALALIDPREHEKAFDMIYRGFLRFILVLAHDAPLFMTYVSTILIATIPLRFTQIRNIVISTVVNDDEKSEVFETDKWLPPNLISSLSQLFKDDAYDSSGLNAIFGQLEEQCEFIVICEFVSKVCSSSLKSGKSAKETPAFSITCELFRNASPELAARTANALVDRLGNNDEKSAFFADLLLALLETDVFIVPQVSLTEVILRVIFERASTPAPRPAALAAVMKRILLLGNGTWLVNLPLVKNSDSVKSFVAAIRSVFCS